MDMETAPIRDVQHPRKQLNEILSGHSSLRSAVIEGVNFFESLVILGLNGGIVI
jgi:hypothetical protein